MNDLMYGGNWGPSAEQLGTLAVKPSSDNSTWTRLNAFRATNQFTDVVLVMDDGTEFPCHRSVLAATSQYFFAMFTSQMREAKEMTIPISKVSSEMMKLALDFIYIGTCSFLLAKFFDFLMLANMLSIEGLLSV